MSALIPHKKLKSKIPYPKSRKRLEIIKIPYNTNKTKYNTIKNNTHIHKTLTYHNTKQNTNTKLYTTPNIIPNTKK